MLSIAPLDVFLLVFGYVFGVGAALLLAAFGLWSVAYLIASAMKQTIKQACASPIITRVINRRDRRGAGPAAEPRTVPGPAGSEWLLLTTGGARQAGRNEAPVRALPRQVQRSLADQARASWGP